jgi:alpha-N-arabinofuranosidase
LHPDPSICRVGRDFYLACSSFEYFPGVPLYHSRDLVTWRPLGHALTRGSQLDLTGVPSSGGIHAPTLRHHEGMFLLVTTLAGRGHLLVTARDPRGPWSEPTWLPGDGFDPSLAFLDGRVHLTRTGKGSGPDHPFIYQAELERAHRPRVVWKGTGGIWTEGPHLYRRGEWHYLVTAEGGTSYGHSVVVARGRSPYGPFAPSPHGPLLTHRERPRHPIQAVGHADLVELDDGSTWAVLLGVRPTAGRHHHLGRETFLAPVRWGEDGWPRMGPVEPVMEGPPLPRSRESRPPRREGFTGRTLPTDWMFVRNPSEGDWTLRERPGFLRLRGAPAGLGDVASPAAVFRRQDRLEGVARTLLSFEPGATDERAGLCVRASEEFHVALLVAGAARGRELRLERTIAGRTATIGRRSLGRGPVTLEVRAAPRSYTFLGGTGSHREELGRVSTRSLSAETILARTGRHHFTGATIGLFATGSGRPSTARADFHWFEWA